MSKKRLPEPEALNSVKAFHELFEMPVLEQPKIPSSERCALRVSLLQEELNELKQAIEDHDLVEIADALSDLQYVLSGAILEFGLGERFKALFDEVQRSNMSKACATIEEAEATRKYYKEARNTDSYIRQKGDEYLVFREGDSKVLKSVKYSPADLSKFLK